MRLSDDENAMLVSDGDLTKVGNVSDAVSVLFTCPCGRGHVRIVPFDTNPHYPKGWKATGTSLEDLTLRPSIKDVGGCGWHGFVTDGVAK